MSWKVDPGLKQFATTDQLKEYIDLVNDLDSFRKAAKAMGVPHGDFLRVSVRRLERRAASMGYSPAHDLTRTVPEPFIVSGVSTYYGAEEGKPAQWIKSKLNPEYERERMERAVQAFVAEVTPISVARAPRTSAVNTDIIPWIQIGDAHLGMIAHEAETGERFNLEIAERELYAAAEMLIDELPGYYERIVVNDLGDGTHAENMSGTTEASGHALDMDGRFPDMIEVYSRVMRRIIDKALTKAKIVDVAINQGNHSRTNDIWMAVLLRAVYGASGRVNVLNNRSVFIPYRMGKTLVLIHHSDKTKPAELPKILASDYAQDWGETEHRYIDIGHIHHRMAAKELTGCTLESWNQLAPGDKWAHEAGYRSRQSITVVFRSRSYGDVGRRVLPIEEVRDRIHAALSEGDSIYRPAPRRAFAV